MNKIKSVLKKSRAFPIPCLLILLLGLTVQVIFNCSLDNFSFIIIADPHIAGTTDNENILTDCVNWINANKEIKRIELVFVVGDIAWGSGNLTIAKNLLDNLTIPYVPVIGDNVIETGYETEFNTTFASHYDYLATFFENWNKSAVPVANPETGKDSYFQNFSFDHRGIHFVGLDWCTRLGGESADLHDFPGGTWQWFTQDIASCRKTASSNIVLFSHLPMHYIFIYDVFSKSEDTTLKNFTLPYNTSLYANFAGHYHVNWYENRTDGGYELYVTGAPWFGSKQIRLVGVQKVNTAVFFAPTMINVP